MITWSMGWFSAKFSRIWREKHQFYGLQAGNLGMCRAIVNDEGYFPVLLIHLLVGFTRDMKISDVIQAFMLALYWTGRDLTFLKHRGLTALPMTSMGSLSLPSMFVHVISVSLSLFFLPPWQSTSSSVFLVMQSFYWIGCQLIFFRRKLSWMKSLAGIWNSKPTTKSFESDHVKLLDKLICFCLTSIGPGMGMFWSVAPLNNFKVAVSVYGTCINTPLKR